MTTAVDAATQARVNLRAYVLLILTAICWGGNAIFGRLAVGEISPMALVTARWLGVSLLLAIFAHRQLRHDWPVLRPHLFAVAALGIMGFATFNGLFYVAAHYTTAVNIGILQGSMPIIVLFGAFLAYRTRITGLQALGAVVTLAGVVVVGSHGSLERLAALKLNFGDVLMLIACALYAVYTIALRKRPPSSTIGLFAVMAFASFLASLPMVAGEAALGQFQWPTAKGWLVVGLVTLFPSFVAQVFFIKGVELIGPGRAGIFVNLVPVFASFLAVVVLGEPFEPFHAAALALVLGGIWLSERGKAA